MRKITGAILSRALGGGALLLLAMGLAAELPAAWDDPKEANAKIVKRSITFEVEGDGTFETKEVSVTEVLKDSARSDLGTMTRVWNSDASRLLSVHAWTINNGREIPVPRQHIDTNYVAFASIGFDRFQRTMISFPEILVGSRTKAMWHLKTEKVPVSGLFSDGKSFGEGYLEEAGSQILYISAMPLHLFVSDPGNYLKTRQWREGNRYYTEVALVKAAFFQLKDEPGAWMERPLHPYIEVSSAKDWQLIRTQIAKGFERELTAPLPPSFARKVNEIKQSEPTLRARSDLWTSWLVDRVRYMGDWRTVKGGYEPRPMKDIEKSGFGDCKDYATVTVKALREMGYKAYVAIVRRGWGRSMPIDTPRLEAFNHAIVYAEDKDGKVFWIDPTNDNSFAGGKRPDIAGRPSLVLDKSESTQLQHIPELLPDDSRIHVRLEFSPNSQTTRKLRLELLATGTAALEFTGMELSESQEKINKRLLRWFTDDSEVLDSKVEPYDSKSRIVKDFKFVADISHKWLPLKSTAGFGHQLNGRMWGLQRIQLHSRITGYQLGDPQKLEEELLFKNSILVGDAVRNCSIDNSWFRLERLIEQRGPDIYVRNYSEKRRPGISLADLKSETGREVRSKLRSCFGEMNIIYKVNSELLSDVPFEDETSPAH